MLHVVAELQEAHESLAHPSIRAVGERLQAMYGALGGRYAWSFAAPWYGTRSIATDLVERGLLRIQLGDIPCGTIGDLLPNDQGYRLALSAAGLAIVVATLDPCRVEEAVAGPSGVEIQRGRELAWVPLS